MRSIMGTEISPVDLIAACSKFPILETLDWHQYDSRSNIEPFQNQFVIKKI